MVDFGFCHRAVPFGYCLYWPNIGGDVDPSDVVYNSSSDSIFNNSDTILSGDIWWLRNVPTVETDPIQNLLGTTVDAYGDITERGGENSVRRGFCYKIGNTGKSFDGSGNVSWSLAEIGAQPAGSYADTSHNHDDRYLTYAASNEPSNLAAGWYTIAVNSGNRASGKFILRDTSSGNHQSTVFYATHHYGSYSDITVLINSSHHGNPFRYIRIRTIVMCSIKYN